MADCEECEGTGTMECPTCGQETDCDACEGTGAGEDE